MKLAKTLIKKENMRNFAVHFITIKVCPMYATFLTRSAHHILCTIRNTNIKPFWISMYYILAKNFIIPFTLQSCN